MEYKVNADFLINVNAIIDDEDVTVWDGETLEEAIRRQATSMMMCGNYTPGDPINVPKINWVK